MSTQHIITGFDPNGPFAGLFLPARFRRRQAETRFKQEWRLTLAQYVAMMREFKGPKRQRGNFAMFPAGSTMINASSGSVVLTNHTFTALRGSAGTVTATVNFGTGGDLWGRRSTQTDIQYSGEWWTAHPVASIGDDYEVRALSTGKTGTWSTSAAADDVWITMTANRDWTVTRSTTGQKNTVATFEVGLDAVESALDSCVMDVTAWVDNV